MQKERHIYIQNGKILQHIQCIEVFVSSEANEVYHYVHTTYSFVLRRILWQMNGLLLLKKWFMINCKANKSLLY